MPKPKKKFDSSKIIDQYHDLLELMASECKRHWLNSYLYWYIRDWDSISECVQNHHQLHWNLRAYDAWCIRENINRFLSTDESTWH